jgi:putative ABC transport system permease protein
MNDTLPLRARAEKGCLTKRPISVTDDGNQSGAASGVVDADHFTDSSARDEARHVDSVGSVGVKYFPIIWAGLWRRPARSIFTLLSVSVAFFLFGILQGLNAGFDKAIADQHLDRLITDTRVPGAPPMSISAREQIERIPGVTQVAQRATLMGTYREPKNVVAFLATDPQRFFDVRPEFGITPEHFAALQSTRTGLVVTPPLMQYFGWKVGDRISIKSKTTRRDGSDVWTFDIVGVFDTRPEPTRFYLSLMNYQYLDEARFSGQGEVERYIVRIADPGRSVATAAAIDRLFANSRTETRTRSEQEMALVRLKQVGDIKFVTSAVIGAVFFTLLFLTANTMGQSVRDRTAEFGVLKSIGWSDTRILCLIFAEAGVLCVVAAVIGLALAATGAPLLEDAIGSVHMSAPTILAGIAAATLVALSSAILPAWRIRRLTVIDALAGR